MAVDDQRAIDHVLETTDTKQINLEADTMPRSVLSVLHAGAATREQPLWEAVGVIQEDKCRPNTQQPGVSCAETLAFDCDLPRGSGYRGLALVAEIYHQLKSELKADGLLGGVGDEGGFAQIFQLDEETSTVRALEEQVIQSTMLELLLMLQQLNLRNRMDIIWTGMSLIGSDGRLIQ